VATVKMYDDQIETTTDLMRSLLATQFPHWSDLPIQPVQESGTDHALYRIGDALVARLPIIEWAVDQAESDQRWLPLLAPSLTLPIPVPWASQARDIPGPGWWSRGSPERPRMGTTSTLPRQRSPWPSSSRLFTESSQVTGR
jgi:hypothetical protein